MHVNVYNLLLQNHNFSDVPDLSATAASAIYSMDV